jgi:hypothetical protein
MSPDTPAADDELRTREKRSAVSFTASSFVP